jgi:HEAT repeats
MEKRQNTGGTSMTVRSILISLSLGFIAMSLMMIIYPPDSAEVNLGNAYELVRVSTFAAILISSLLIAVCAKRFKVVGYIGIGLIIVSLAVSFVLQKTSGGSVGSHGWVSGFVGMLVIIPMGLLMCSISGMATLIDILGKNPSAIKPVIASFAVPAILLAAFYIVAGREPDIAALLETFQKPDEMYEYTIAASRLSQIDDLDMIDPLIALLENENPRIRGAAAMALAGRSRHVKAINPLLNALDQETDADARDWIIRALGVTAPKADVLKQTMVADVLIEKLITGDNRIKQAAAENLGFMKAKKAIKPLIDAMRIEEVRFHAHNALIAITGRRLGDDPDAWLRWWRETQGKTIAYKKIIFI